MQRRASQQLIQLCRYLTVKHNSSHIIFNVNDVNATTLLAPVSAGGGDVPSLDMPTEMHFLRRQYWQRLRLTRMMLHCWFLRQGRYWIFCWMERRKKPLQPSHACTP